MFHLPEFGEAHRIDPREEAFTTASNLLILYRGETESISGQKGVAAPYLVSQSVEVSDIEIEEESVRLRTAGGDDGAGSAILAIQTDEIVLVGGELRNVWVDRVLFVREATIEDGVPPIYYLLDAANGKEIEPEGVQSVLTTVDSMRKLLNSDVAEEDIDIIVEALANGDAIDPHDEHAELPNEGSSAVLIHDTFTSPDDPEAAALLETLAHLDFNPGDDSA